jgi:hypothetical protein
MLRSNQLIGFGGRRPNAYPFWRLVSGSTMSLNLWDLQPDATAIVSEAGDLSGADIAEGLAYANLHFFTSGDVESFFDATTKGNPFASSGNRLASATNMGVGSYLKFTFSKPVNFGSVKWYALTGFAARQPTTMTLQHSNDGSSWTSYATLTNGSTISPARWQNIVRGGTHAAT